MRSEDPSRNDADALLRLASARMSCRAFLPDGVPRAEIERILKIAQMTASWNNTQPWHVHIASGATAEKFRAMMSDLARSGAEQKPDLPFPREYRGVFQERRRACGFALYNAVGVARGDKEAYARQTLRNFSLFDAPHVAIVTTPKDLDVYGAVDCGAYVANFMLAAQSLGVGTIAQAALALYSRQVRSFFSIHDARQVVCGISFGWPDMSHPANRYRTERADISEVITFCGE